MKDPIKKNQRWVTGAWRAHPRYLTIDKVESDEIYFTFDDGQESNTSRTAFLRTFVRVPMEKAS